jgi:hypothetical protein
VLLGEYTNDSYNALLSSVPEGIIYDSLNANATRRLRLQAPATTTTGIPLNLTLDYLKFVPVF